MGGGAGNGEGCSGRGLVRAGCGGGSAPDGAAARRGRRPAHRRGLLPAVPARRARRGVRDGGRGRASRGAGRRRHDGGRRPALLRGLPRQGVLRPGHAHALRGDRGSDVRLPHLPAARPGGAPRRPCRTAPPRRPRVRAEPVHGRALSGRCALRAGGVLCGTRPRASTSTSGATRLRASFTLGGEPVERDGFVVGAGCIGCGTCVDACPQGCGSSSATPAGPASSPRSTACAAAAAARSARPAPSRRGKGRPGGRPRLHPGAAGALRVEWTSERRRPPMSVDRPPPRTPARRPAPASPAIPGELACADGLAAWIEREC